MAVITEQKLKRLIKEGVKEALSTELVKLRILALPNVLDKEEADSEASIVRWSKEAKKLHKAGKLPILRSLKDLR